MKVKESKMEIKLTESEKKQIADKIETFVINTVKTGQDIPMSFWEEVMLAVEQILNARLSSMRLDEGKVAETILNKIKDYIPRGVDDEFLARNTAHAIAVEFAEAIAKGGAK